MSYLSHNQHNAVHSESIDCLVLCILCTCIYVIMYIAVNFKQCIAIADEGSRAETFYADTPTAMNFNNLRNTMSTVSNQVYPNQINYGAGLLS